MFWVKYADISIPDNPILSDPLRQIWQIADHENRGLLTKPGFSVALRLIGHYQAGREPTAELAFRRMSRNYRCYLSNH
jgi:hypothetical protein